MDTEAGALGTEVKGPFDNDPVDNVPQPGSRYIITKGTRPDNGPNLFHSFSHFSVQRHDIANFHNDSGLPTTNIVSRVTGGDPSKINGTIKTTGFQGAHLFFLNPAGVIFGPHSRLEVEGSFHVSTADYLRLDDGHGIFHATDTEQSMLTVAPPTAFGFLQDDPAGVSIDRSNLSVLAGETLSVVAGDIDIKNGGLRAPRGQLQIASADSVGEAVFDQMGLETESIAQGGNLEVLNSSVLDVSGAGGGQVLIRAGQFMLRGQSELNADTTGHQPGRGIDIEVDSLFQVTGSTISSNAVNESTGAAGNLTLIADSLKVRKGAKISAGTGSSSIGGNLRVEADTVSLSGGSLISVDTRGGPDSGGGGSLTLKTNSLEVRNGARISANTQGGGDGGDVLIEANNILLSGDGATEFTGISANTFAGGDGGDLLVKADTILLSGNRDGPVTGITAGTNGAGRGGNIKVEAREVQLRDGATISADARNAATANADAGKLTIVAAEAFRSTDSSVTTRARQSDGGNIELKAGEIVLLINSDITTSVGTGKGDGGNITIDPVFVVLDSSRIRANAFGGDGGNIRIVADYFFASADSLVEASSALGIDGQVIIDSPNTYITGPLSPLSATYLDPSAIIGSVCAERSGAHLSRLVVKPYDVLPDAPRALRVYLPKLSGTARAAKEPAGETAVNDAPANLGQRQLRFRCADTL